MASPKECRWLLQKKKLPPSERFHFHSRLTILPLRLVVVRWRVEAGAVDDVADGCLRLLAVQLVGTLQAQAVDVGRKGAAHLLVEHTRHITAVVGAAARDYVAEREVRVQEVLFRFHILLQLLLDAADNLAGQWLLG